MKKLPKEEKTKLWVAWLLDAEFVRNELSDEMDRDTEEKTRKSPRPPPKDDR